MSIGKQLAFLVAVLCISSAIGVIFMNLMLAFSDLMAYPTEHHALSGIFGFSLFVGFFAVPIAIAFGVPAFFFLRRFGLLKWWSVFGLGTLAGTLIGSTDFVSGVPWIGCVILGSTSALIAWLLIVRSNMPLNPDAPKSGAPVS